ncbi:MAG: hypothetical protein B7Z72_13920 [Gemmatimonadetes bacterium 21-71-4]|nr:MAG: hypothetical protein B7Z72_13920 [Gemmatimonadetes bacterium 21-71-4]
MRAAIVDRPLDPSALLAEVSDPAHGAAVLFVGAVRDTNGGRGVRGIEYTAYREMAEAELDRIVAEAAAQWPRARVVLRHRLGDVPAGEASVAVVAAAPHRAEAFAAARFVIDETKHRVPIWKRERLAGGETRWVEGQPPGG